MLIIGYGNRERGDDAAGIFAAEHLQALGIPAKSHTGDPLALFELWRGADAVVLIDAVLTGAPVGTINNWGVNQILEAKRATTSTHGLDLAHVIELARNLGNLPAKLRLYAIDGKQFQVGAAMSEEVKYAVHQVVSQIASEFKG
jgi:hydrogenase maturation protease